MRPIFPEFSGSGPEYTNLPAGLPEQTSFFPSAS
jgi:hypothetical protein